MQRNMKFLLLVDSNTFFVDGRGGVQRDDLTMSKQ